MCNMQNYNCPGISFYACKIVLPRSNEGTMLLQNSNQQICGIGKILCSVTLIVLVSIKNFRFLICRLISVESI